MGKKILIGVAIFLGIVIIAVASVTVWQWRNIKALYIAATNDEDTISEKLKENDEKFANEVKDYLKENIRDFTDEEVEQIEKGDATKTEVLAKIISESVAENGSLGSTAVDSAGGQSSAHSETSEQIVARHVANLYAYQSEFESKVNSLAATVTSYMHSYKATHPNITWRDAKVATVQHYMSSATSIESECYSKVDNEVALLRSELKAIGADMSIADKVAESAENQMELKKSKLMSQYLNKMNKPE